MKPLLVALFVVLSRGAIAETPREVDGLASLAHHTPARHVELGVSLDGASSTTEVAEAWVTRGEDLGASATLTFGVVGDLRLAVSWGALFAGVLTSETSSSTTSGLSDPGVHLRWGFTPKAWPRVRFVSSLSWWHSLAPHRVATATSPGDDFTGGDSGSLAVSAIAFGGGLEYAAFARASMHLPAEELDDALATRLPFVDAAAGVTLRQHYSAQLYGEVGGTLSSPTSITFAFDDPRLGTSRYDVGLGERLFLESGWTPTPDWLVDAYAALENDRSVFTFEARGERFVLSTTTFSFGLETTMEF